jgi:hypothetical protein
MPKRSNQISARIQLDRVGQRSIGFLGRVGQSRPPEHFNDVLRDLHGDPFFAVAVPPTIIGAPGRLHI